MCVILVSQRPHCNIPGLYVSQDHVCFKNHCTVILYLLVVKSSKMASVEYYFTEHVSAPAS